MEPNTVVEGGGVLRASAAGVVVAGEAVVSVLGVVVAGVVLASVDGVVVGVVVASVAASPGP